MRAFPVLACLALLALPSVADPAADGVAFLRARQGADGGIVDPWLSSWSAIALAAAGADPAATSRGGATLGVYLAAHAGGRDPSGAAALESARAVVAAASLGADPTTFAGIDHVASLRATYDGRQFGAASTFNDDAWAIFALTAAGAPASDEAIQSAATVILASQHADGGFGLTATSFSDVDMTGWSLVALRLAERTMGSVEEAAVERALRYLDTVRDPGGAFPQCVGAGCAGPNAESTAAALAAARALGAESRYPDLAGALARFQRADGGFYRTAAATAPWAMATPQSLIALGRGYPPLRWFDPAPAAPARAVAAAPWSVRAEADRCEWTHGTEVATSCAATFVARRAGESRLTLRAWRGDHGYARFELVVPVDPAPPRPALAAPAHAPRHAPVAFDASASIDPDGAIAAFRFRFGDGNATAWTASPWASHGFERPGLYHTFVDVRDGDGLEASATRDVIVDNAPPTLAVDTPSACTPGRPVLLRARADDAEGDAVAVRWQHPGGATEGADLSRSFPEGQWTVVAIAEDEHGARAEVRVALDCRAGASEPPRVEPSPAAPAAPRPPTLRVAAPATVEAGRPFALALDVDDDEPGARAQVLLDGRALATALSAAGLVANVSGLAPGRHTVVARAIDDDGLASELVTATITALAPAAPSLEAQAPTRPAPAAGLLLALLAATAPALRRRARR